MLFRKVGAEKEEGRAKEDSLSETLRALKVAGLGRAKHRMPTGYFCFVSIKYKRRKSMAQKERELRVTIHGKIKQHKRKSRAVRNSDRKRVMLLSEEEVVVVVGLRRDQSAPNRRVD